jgi:hypothetical protein
MHNLSRDYLWELFAKWSILRSDFAISSPSGMPYSNAG